MTLQLPFSDRQTFFPRSFDLQCTYKTMRSTLPTTILTIVLASVVYPSSALLTTRGLDGAEPSCQKSDFEPFLPHRAMENPFEHPNSYTVEDLSEIKKLITFTGTMEDLTGFNEACEVDGRLVFTDYDYSAGCQLHPTSNFSHLISAVNVPLCVPQKCVGDDWMTALIDYSYSASPMLTP
jgi:hypothetical protein